MLDGARFDSFSDEVMKERITFETEMLNLGLSSPFREASIGALHEQEIIA
jgi:hypothetical protein